MKQHSKNLGLIGLANKAGKVKIGRSAVEKSIHENKAKLLVFAEDASPKVIVYFNSISEGKNIPTLHTANKKLLGKHFGRGEVAVASICDDNFAKGLLKSC